MGVSLSPLAEAVEKHNLIVSDGRARVRPGWATHATYSDALVGGFTVVGNTGEPWQYIFTQAASGKVTLTVADERIVPIFALDLGAMPLGPIITWGVAQAQLMISGPSFSSTLYGPVGQGLIPARATTNPDPLLTSLEIPTGILCAWHNRICIAQGNVVYVNTGRLDPREFIAENALPFPAPVLDMFEGPDGGLWVFTSRDAYVVAADALSESQLAEPFTTTLPNVSTSRSGNACATAGTVLALAPDGVLEVTTSGQTKIDVSPYEGRRYWTPDTRIDDMRACRIFPTPTGAIVSYLGAAPVSLVVDMRNRSRSYVWTRTVEAFGLAFDKRTIVGVLLSREGTPLYLLAPPFGAAYTGAATDSLIVEAVGSRDPNTELPVRGVACLRSPIPADSSPVARFVTMAADNVGQRTNVYLGGTSSTLETPARATKDTIVGTTTWEAFVFPFLADREMRTRRHAFAERIHDIQVEIGVEGAGCSFDAGDVEMRGQAKSRRSRM